MGSYQRLVRSLRKAREDLERCAGTVTIYEDCCECGSRVLFKFFDIPQRQTKYAMCSQCGETLRLVKTLSAEQRAERNEN